MRDDATSARPSLPGGPIRPVEVRELWAFLHGYIMEAGIRQQLRQSLGLCPRHAWGYAIVEIELWTGGVGNSLGHQPFDACVLYEDLLAMVAARLRRRRPPWRRDIRHALRGQGPCKICQAVAYAERASTPVTVGYGFADAHTIKLTGLVNSLEHTTQWCRDTEPAWRPAACPICRAGEWFWAAAASAEETVSAGGPGFVCRPHLLDDQETAAPDPGQLAEELGRVRKGVDRFLRSMTSGGPEASMQDRSSWIEAFGWFAGWQLPLRLAASPR